jgi:hypothetical protein
MATRRFEKRPSIEENICNMLNKLLDDSRDEDEERDKMTAVSTIDSSVLGAQNYQRTEKKTQSHKERNVQIFNKINEVKCDESNYDQLYLIQKAQMHRHKKFKTVSTFNTQRMADKFANVINAPEYDINLLNYSKIRLNGVVNYQNNLFSLNNAEMVGEILTDKTEEITPELLAMIKVDLSDIIKTQNGSRIIQNCLTKTAPEIVLEMCNEILPGFHNLMIDCYGNYFCQKFYTFVPFEQKLMILQHLMKYIIPVSNNSIGTYPLQFIIDKLNTSEEKKIVCQEVCDESILKAIMSDPHGVHVIEKITMCFKEEMITNIYDYVLRNFLALANTSTGLVITKKIIMNASLPLSQKRLQILLINNFNTLIQHPFGNYTIQAALDVNYHLT